MSQINTHPDSSLHLDNDSDLPTDLSSCDGPAWLSWSTGKDAAYTLHYINSNYPNIRIRKLLCTVNTTHQRVSLHGTRVELMQLQIDRINENIKANDQATIELYICEIPDKCSHQQYESIMTRCVEKQQQDDIKYILFGDIHLTHVRAYRIKNMLNTGIQPLFPIFYTNPNVETQRQLAYSIVRSGIEAILVCIDARVLSADYIGAKYTIELVDRLCELGIDCCGEKGEFHTFVTNSPLFSRPIDYELREVRQDGNFCMIDVLVATPIVTALL